MKESRSLGSLFVTFEGGEGAGKTTLMEGVYQTLSREGYSALKVREPGGTKLGEALRAILLAKEEKPLSPYAELCLFLAARAQHLLEVIVPALQEGKIVLCDRFHDSSLVYQGVARNLGREEVKRFCAFVSQGIVPALTLYLDIEPSVGLARARKRNAVDRLEAEGLSFHTKIREAYLRLVQEEPKRIRLLDASASPEQVLREAMIHIHSVLDTGRNDRARARMGLQRDGGPNV